MPASWRPDRLAVEFERLAFGQCRGRALHRVSHPPRRPIAIEAACWQVLDPRAMVMASAHPELYERGVLPSELAG